MAAPVPPPGSGNITDTANLPAGGSATYTALVHDQPERDRHASSNTATATVGGGVTDPNPGNNSATDTDARRQRSADLSITKTDGVANVHARRLDDYTIVASNAGPSSATGVSRDRHVPGRSDLHVDLRRCGRRHLHAPSGSGNIADTINLPSGGSVTYTATCAIADERDRHAVEHGHRRRPGRMTDPNPANNSATDTDTVGAGVRTSTSPKTDGVTSVAPAAR